MSRALEPRAPLDSEPEQRRVVPGAVVPSSSQRALRASEPAKLVDTFRAQNLIYAPRHSGRARFKSGVAQLVEQLTVNQRVTGSSPVAGVLVAQRFTGMANPLRVGYSLLKSPYSLHNPVAYRDPRSGIVVAISGGFARQYCQLKVDQWRHIAVQRDGTNDRSRHPDEG